MSIKPLADRILVKPLVAEEKTIGGIIIPDSAKEKPAKGKIIAVGTGTKDEEMILKVGDIILYDKDDVIEIEHEGEKFLIMRQNDALATL
jgi:chaperonin 10 Kd subunit